MEFILDFQSCDDRNDGTISNRMTGPSSAQHSSVATVQVAADNCNEAM